MWNACERVCNFGNGQSFWVSQFLALSSRMCLVAIRVCWGFFSRIFRTFRVPAQMKRKWRMFDDFQTSFSRSSTENLRCGALREKWVISYSVFYCYGYCQSYCWLRWWWGMLAYGIWGPGHSKLNLNAQRFQFRNASLRHSAVANPFCVTFVRSRCNTYVARPMIDEKIGIHADKYGPTPTS